MDISSTSSLVLSSFFVTIASILSKATPEIDRTGFGSSNRVQRTDTVKAMRGNVILRRTFWTLSSAGEGDF